MAKGKQTTRGKTVGRQGSMRSKTRVVLKSDIHKKKQAPPQTRVLRDRKPPDPEPVLTAFQVCWRAHPSNTASYVSFRLRVTATFSRGIDPSRILYRQYTRDRLSIAAGHDPGNLQFKANVFTLDTYTADHAESQVEITGSLEFQDNPGYTNDFGLDATTDLHYTFGVHWNIRLDGTEVLNTVAHPLFGTAVGAHPRIYTPVGLQTANYDLEQGNWVNTGTLLTQWPALPAGYPDPPVDNT